jgi:heme exporter protein D
MGYFHSFNQFLAMGGYAIYVWSAYFFLIFIFLLTWIKAQITLKKLLKQDRSQSPKIAVYASKTQT